MAATAHQHCQCPRALPRRRPVPMAAPQFISLFLQKIPNKSHRVKYAKTFSKLLREKRTNERRIKFIRHGCRTCLAAPQTGKLPSTRRQVLFFRELERKKALPRNTRKDAKFRKPSLPFASFRVFRGQLPETIADPARRRTADRSPPASLYRAAVLGSFTGAYSRQLRAMKCHHSLRIP